MKEQDDCFYDFDSFRIDTLKRSLLFNGQDLQLTPKAFATLLVLARRSGEIVSKDELLNAVWADTFVEENNLTQQVSVLRKKFKELAGKDEFIITMPKQGYKFAPAVTKIRYEPKQNLPSEISCSESDIFARAAAEKSLISVRENPPKSVIKFLFSKPAREITLGCALMMLVFWFSFYVENRQLSAKNSTIRKSIAVLEFEPLDDNSKSSLYSTGITRTLTAKIGNLETIVLRPSGISGRFYGQERDITAIGNQLQADIVLEGSVQNEGDLVRISVVAWDSKANRQLWGNVFTKNSSNIFSIQDEIAGEIISAVQHRLLN